MGFRSIAAHAFRLSFPCSMKFGFARLECSMDRMHHALDSDSTHSYADHAMAGRQPDHDRHAGHSVAMFRDKFWWTLAFTIPVVVWSADVQHWLGYHAPTFPGSRLVPAILGTIVLVYGGSLFIQGAGRELSAGPPGLITFVS